MRTLAVVFASFLIAIAGCSSQPSGPTYAEAVATYQAEVALLDSLQAKLKAASEEYNETVGKHGAIYADVIPTDQLSSMRRHVESLPREKVISLAESGRPSDDNRDGYYHLCLLTRGSYFLQSGEIEKQIADQMARVEKAKAARDRLSR